MSPNATLSLHTKLAQVAYEVDRIPKNGHAPREMGGYSFVQVGDAADAIRKALAEKKVTMIPSAIEMLGESEHPTKAGGTMTTVTVRVTWTLTDGDTGETAVIQSMGTGADTGDKFTPKAQTNAMKYALLMGFLLSTGDDPEGAAIPERESRPPTRAQNGHTRPAAPPPATNVPDPDPDALAELHAASAPSDVCQWKLGQGQGKPSLVCGMPTGHEGEHSWIALALASGGRVIPPVGVR